MYRRETGNIVRIAERRPPHSKHWNMKRGKLEKHIDPLLESIQSLVEHFSGSIIQRRRESASQFALELIRMAR